MTVRLLAILSVVAAVLACVLRPRRGASAYMADGDRLSGYDQYEQAVAAYQEALERDPALLGAHLGKARALNRLDDIQRAQACYREAIAVAGEDDLRRSEIMIESAELYEREGQHDQAFELYRQVREFWPENVCASYGVARSHMRLGRPGEAADIYAAQLRADESDIGAVHALASAHREMGLADEALAGYRRYVDHVLSGRYGRTSLARTLVEYADVCAQFGHFEEAYQAYAQARDYLPDWPAPFCGMGDALTDDGKVGDAVDCYRRALKMDPQWEAAWCGLGRVHRLADRISEALKACRQAIEINPQFAAAHLELGRVYEAMGQAKEAAEAFEEAVRLDPHSSEARQAANDIRSPGLGDD
jgi:tetratricopeptide (TPR) repeat protein